MRRVNQTAVMKTALVVLPLSVACSDHGFSPVDKYAGADGPRIEVEPASLEFWVGGTSTTDTQSFVVRSIGASSLSLDALELVDEEGDAGWTLGLDGLPLELPPGEEREVPVTFAPVGPGAATARVLVRSNDEELPQVPVTLAGRADTPSLRISPDPYDFGTERVGCPSRVELKLENVGTAALTIEGWSYTGDSGLAHAPSEGLPIVLAPGSWVFTEVDFSPTFEGTAAGSLVVESTDPRGEVSANQSGTGEAVGAGEDRFPVVDDLPVDILLAIDRSASMEDDAARLTAGFSGFLSVLAGATTGWHLGVVTLDDGCFNEGVLAVDTPGLSAAFGTAVSTGEDRDIALDESLLQLSDRAAAAAEDGGCNAGFRRENSLLHVIVVTDEPERSVEEAAAWTWDFWVDRLRDRAGGSGSLQISGIVDSEDCNEGADGYLEAISETGGEVHSVCEADWGVALASLAEASLGRLRVLSLTAEPIPASIVVLLDGVEQEGNWSYDAEANAVVVSGGVAGTELVVQYLLDGECADEG
jgi:hypothetical protein